MSTTRNFAHPFIIEDEDIIGNQSIIDNRVDAGAYEYFNKHDLNDDPGTIKAIAT